MLRWFQSLFKSFEKEPSEGGSSSYEEEDMWLFVGLGNPGGKYELNRHNVGFMVMDAILDEHPEFGAYKAKFQGQMAEGRIGGQKVIVLKPETYMNNSGQSVKGMRAVL